MENKPTAILLDDERQVDFIKVKVNTNNYEWIVIRNYFEFVNYIDENYNNIALVAFDHDIDSFDESGMEWTGRDAARYLIDKCQDPDNTGLNFPDFLVHSMNNIGRQNIIADIKHHISKFERRGDWQNWKYFHTGFVDGKFI